MDPTRWKQIDELVDAALDLPQNEREAFVSAQAGNDTDLSRAVIDLLVAQNETNDFLQNSAMKIVAKAIAQDEPERPAYPFINKTIGKYRIEKPLGAGGMGEVYLAFDEKMKRKVALKVLPTEFVSNDERVKRFEMEARAISSINHPNIVTIYDVGNFEGINYIATEYVEGKTLRQLIGGKFKLRNVMANSIQICDALSAAHNVGIIHRDIKPENIMIRGDGYAKILDFGLAKLSEADAVDAADFAKTNKGVIIGTPGYMSPSQVSGDTVDHRTDLWSCGVVLYEFITGRNPFKGGNRQATFHAILSSDPALCSSLNPDLPEELDHILMKVLEKDPDLGYQTASDLRADLKRVKRELDTSPSIDDMGMSYGRRADRRRRSMSPILYSITALVMLVALFGGGWLYLRSRFAATPWNDAVAQQLTDYPGIEDDPSISPDKKVILFTRWIDGKTDIFWQRIGGANARNLTGESPENDTQPAFSPDGEKIAFRSERGGGGIFIMGATGESVRRLTDFGYSPSWSRDGKKIVVSSVTFSNPITRSLEGKISIIDVADSAVTPVEAGVDASQPTFSPGGRRIAFWGKDEKFQRDLWTVSSAGGDPQRLTNDEALDWNPVWDREGRFIYFCSNRNGQTGIWRIAIDESTGKAAGGPEPVAPLVQSSVMTISPDGKDLVFVQAQRIENIQISDFDAAKMKLTGKPVFLTEGSKRARTVDISPSGNEIVFYVTGEGQEDIYLLKMDDLKWNQLTNDSARDRVPRFSPDGSRIAFYSNITGTYEIWTVKPDGSDRRQLTNIGELGIQYPLWSPDGTQMSYSVMSGASYIFDPTKPWADQTPVQLPPLGAAGDRFTPWSWSPDGTKIAGWRSNQSVSEIPEVWVYKVADRTYEKIADNGFRPCWLADNRNILFTRNPRLMAVDTVTRAEREVSSAAPQLYDTVRVSKDNRRVVYTLDKEEGDIHMLSLK